MSDNIIIDKEKLSRILKYSYKEAQKYKSLNATVVDKIIEKLKEELKDDED